MRARVLLAIIFLSLLLLALFEVRFQCLIGRRCASQCARCKEVSPTALWICKVPSRSWEPSLLCRLLQLCCNLCTILVEGVHYPRLLIRVHIRVKLEAVWSCRSPIVSWYYWNFLSVSEYRWSSMFPSRFGAKFDLLGMMGFVLCLCRNWPVALVSQLCNRLMTLLVD